MKAGLASFLELSFQAALQESESHPAAAQVLPLAAGALEQGKAGR
jgi:hypothetical protein